MKKPTNLSPLLITIFVLALGGCTMNNDSFVPISSGEYFMKFTVNGVAVIYTDVLAATFSEFPEIGLQGASIVGANFEGPNTDNDLGITLFASEKVALGTFTQEPVIGLPSFFQAHIGYVKNGAGYSSASPIISSVAKARVEISELNETFIAGTFSGDLVSAEGDYDAITHVLEKGEFKIQITK